MTYLLPPLNALRAFEAAARHLSLKLAANELHVTPGAISQQVKTLEERLGTKLFDRLHKQLILSDAGQAYLPAIRGAFRRIADATMELKPAGVAVTLTLGLHGRCDAARFGLTAFRRSHPSIGLRLVQPAGLHELEEAKVDLLVDRGLGHHPRYRCDRLDPAGPSVGDVLICPEGTADCPAVVRLRGWLLAAESTNVAQLPRVAGARR